MKNLVEKVKGLFIEEEELCGSIIIKDMADYYLLKDILENKLNHYETDVYKDSNELIVVTMVISENKYEKLIDILRKHGRSLQHVNRIGLTSEMIKIK